MQISRASLCVLASSSSGNCSVLRIEQEHGARHILIDAGLSPRRTHGCLRALGIDRFDTVLLTHLDHDHWHSGWLAAMPEHVTVHIHRRHLGRAERCGLAYLKLSHFMGSFEPVEGVRVHPVLMLHDSLGTAAFRIELDGMSATLGFVTDAGRPSEALCDHLAGVDVLAIESNYCPQMQLASNRPDFLKHRIMSGHGHLSNAQSADAVQRIEPGSALILLHLSRECNSPALALQAHARAGCPIHVALPDSPTPWIDIVPSNRERSARARQQLLWA